MRKFSIALLVVAASCDRETPRAANVGDAMPIATGIVTLVATPDAAKPPEPGRTGAVTITQSTKRSGTSAGAYFMETSAPGIDCTIGASAGGCTLRVCTRSLIQSVTSRKTAGDVLVTVGQFPSTLPAIKDGTNDWYAPLPLARVKDGEIVRVSAVGGASIPAFEGAVTAPAWVSLSKPVIPLAPKTLSVNQSTDLEFVWSPATKGLLNVTLVRAERAQQTSVECAFDGIQAKGTVAKTLLASLPLGHAVFSIDVGAKSVVKAGDFAVTLAVSDSILSGGAEIIP